MQDGQESYVDGLLSNHANHGHDLSLSESWIDLLAALYTPGRYLMSGMQMLSAYLLQVAPASTITNCAAFQEADQYRWLSRIAYRTRELANAYPQKGFGAVERHQFETAPAWQGFRKLIEKALVAWDWGESFFAFNVVAARAVDEAFLRQFAACAHRHGDTLAPMLADNQLKDSDRSRRWTAALIEQCRSRPENHPVIETWMAKWIPLADEAMEAFCTALPDSPDAATAAKEGCRRYWKEQNLL
jgi:toluene monooxygenase system protein E